MLANLNKRLDPPSHPPNGLHYAVKFNTNSQWTFVFQLELTGRLLTFGIKEPKVIKSKAIEIECLPDTDICTLLNETDNSIVLDHGIFRTQNGTEDEISLQLERGCLEVHLLGARLHGAVRLRRRGNQWSIDGLSGILTAKISALTGRNLVDGTERDTTNFHAKRLWLEWEHFYTEQSQEPEVVVLDRKVVDLNFSAKVRGIALGMPLQHVLPLVPNCKVSAFNPNPLKQKDWLDLLLSYTDTIQPYNEHSAVIDLTGHPNPAEIAGLVVSKLSRTHFGHLRYGIGPAVWVARLATQIKNPFQFCQSPIDSLAPLTIDNLASTSVEVQTRLHRLGFRTIGDVAATSPERLFMQFGQEALSIVSAARAQTIDRVLPLYPPDKVVSMISFTTPVNDSLSLQAAVKVLARRLETLISGKQSGLAILTAEQEDGSELTLSRNYNRPVHSFERIQASLSYLSGELQKSCPDIVKLTASLDHLEPIRSTQQDLFLAQNRTDTRTTIESLHASLGQSSVVLASQIEIPRRVQVLKAWQNATGWN